LEKDYLPQRRKDAKFGVLFKGILSDENLLLCALAPWREINQRAGGRHRWVVVGWRLEIVYVDTGLVVDDDLSLLPEGFSLFLASVFFASPFDSEVVGDFPSLSLFASPLVCPLRA
jgi:hypothetical protein